MTFSIIISYILRKYMSGPFLKIVNVLAAIGIIFHELCHLLMCLISHAPIKDITLIKRIKSDRSQGVGYYGVVNVYEKNTTFLQAFLISFAPLYLSFWLFFYLLDFLLHNQVSALIFFLCFFTMISLVLSAAPSFADLKVIPRAFYSDTYNSYYQILLIIFSILTTWGVVYLYQIQSVHEILIYLIIAGFYFIFKYGFKMVWSLFCRIHHNWIHDFRKPKKIRHKSFTRRRYKPQKQRKYGLM